MTEYLILFAKLLPLLIAIESGGNPNAIGDGGLAVGILQIHPCVVEDVNRLLNHKTFDLEDRYDPAASITMCRIYLFHHWKRGNRDLLSLGCRWNQPYAPDNPKYRAKLKERNER